MTKIACEIEVSMLQKYNEIAKYCVTRDWYSYESPKQYLEELKPYSDDDNTLWEQ